MKILNTLLVGFVIGLTACTTDPNSPGVEYMPDMYRSPAIEAYVDYGQEPYEVGEEANTMMSLPPVATYGKTK